MGLNYGFDIFCDRSQLWDFIDSVAEWSKPTVGHTTALTYGDQSKVVPLWLSQNRNILSLDDPNIDQGFCLSLPFVVDSDIQAYLQETQDTYLRQGTPPPEPQYDEQGRLYVGCVYFSIVTNLDAIERMGYDDNLVGFEFRAATNMMSRLFQKSKSVQQSFVELAKKHDSVYCMFSSGASDQAKVLWLDGQECSVPIPDDWLPMNEVRQIVRSTQA